MPACHSAPLSLSPKILLIIQPNQKRLLLKNPNVGVLFNAVSLSQNFKVCLMFGMIQSARFKISLNSLLTHESSILHYALKAHVDLTPLLLCQQIVNTVFFSKFTVHEKWKGLLNAKAYSKFPLQVPLHLCILGRFFVKCYSEWQLQLTACSSCFSPSKHRHKKSSWQL